MKTKKPAPLNIKKILIYALTVIFSVAYIICGRHMALQGYPDWEASKADSIEVKVTSVIDDTTNADTRKIDFKAIVLSGQMKDEIVTATQNINTKYLPVQTAVKPGDRVLLYATAYADGTVWTMLEFIRSNLIIYLGLAFAAAVIIFGRLKGVNTLISLAFTCLAVFAVFIPSVLAGQNIYIWSVITCVYVVIMTMLIINGANKKSFAASTGCLSGIAIAAVLTVLMSWLLKLTGMVDEDSLFLQMVQTASPIDLRGIIFAAIIIGALGAIMDVAMDIASALYELHDNVPDISSKALIQSGFNIGRDVMGTMANTLVLAYIGSSLATTLLLVAYNVSFLELMNMELIVVELLQALVGSIGIVLAIPLTAIICAAVYTRGKKEAAVSK